MARINNASHDCDDKGFSHADACEEVKKIKAESLYDDIVAQGGKKSPYAFDGPKHELLYGKAKKRAEEFLAFLEKAVTAWHAVEQGEKILRDAGFREYSYADLKDLKPGDLGYYKKNGSLLIAFSVGRNPSTAPWKVYGGHTDSPSLKIKPNSLMYDEGIFKLNTEVYGGPILSTWFDRPLSLAGRVFVKSGDPRIPKEILVDFKRPILLLPNVAIHMNRDVNDGVKIEKQKVLLPFIGSDRLLDMDCFSLQDYDIDGCQCEKKCACGKDDLFACMLSAELGVPTDEILDYDLICYDVTKPCLAGFAEEFIFSGRLDNLTNTEIGLRAMAKTAKNTETFTGVNILILTDNEEVGSRSKQGADSMLTANFFETLAAGFGMSRAEYFDMIDKSFMISADVAHAVHPNYKEYADPTHRPNINGGPIIKVAAAQTYASDGHSESVFTNLCHEAGVPFSYFVNRSDMRGGSTIGPIASAILPIPTVDAGTPIWSMHSCRETAGVLDHYYMSEVIDTFYAM